MSQKKIMAFQVQHMLGVYGWLLFLGKDISLNNFSIEWVKRYSHKFREKNFKKWEVKK